MNTEPQKKTAYSRAVIERTIELQSTPAIKVMNRNFKRISFALYSIAVILPIITKNDEQSLKVDELVDQWFADTEDKLAKEQMRLRKVLEDNGIDTTPHYSNPQKIQATIDTPRANEFLSLLEHLDRVVALIETGWLHGEFTNRQRHACTFMHQKILMKLAGRIIELELRSRKAADAQGKDKEVEARVPAAAPTEADKDIPEVEAEDNVLPLVAEA